jgi:hypothetical protein
MPPKRKANKSASRKPVSTAPATPAGTPPPPPTAVQKTVPPANDPVTTQLVPAPRLYHAVVDVELTSEPILQVIRTMSAQAIQDIHAKAAANGTNNIRGFNWTAIAQQSIEQAEATAKQAILNYVAPIARATFDNQRASDEAKLGTPVVTPEVGGDVEAKEACKASPIPVPMTRSKSRAPSTEVVETVEKDQDEEMVDAGDEEEVDDEVWTSSCFCGLQDNGDFAYKCAGPNCRHIWYHEPCLQKTIHKKNLPTKDDKEDWLCPYCGGYAVKAAMVPETIFGKPKKK